MNSTPRRHVYGSLSLSPALVRTVQLEWEMIERPSHSTRFSNFPLADEGLSRPATDARPSSPSRAPRATGFDQAEAA